MVLKMDESNSEQKNIESVDLDKVMEAIRQIVEVLNNQEVDENESK